MSLRRANEDAVARGLAPAWDAPDPPYAGLVDRVRMRAPNWLGEPAAPPESGRWMPPPRPAEHELTYTVRAFGAWALDDFTGMHGVISRREMAPSQLAGYGGGQQYWELQRRTFRAAPSGPWDSGTAVG